MATISTLTARLKDYARVGDNEGITNANLSQILQDCLYRHDNSLNGDFSRLPVHHEEALLTLAWASVSYVRASKVAPEPNLNISRMTSTAFGQDRDSPFRKAIELAKSLEARYKEMIATIGFVPPGSDSGLTGNIVMGELSVKEHFTDTHTPTPVDTIIGAVLKLVSKGTDYAVISWTKNTDPRFGEYVLFQMLTAGIYQPWNFNSGAGLANIANAAQKLIAINDRAQVSVKVEGLTAGQPYYFLVASKSVTGESGYSNEISVTV